MTFSKDISNNYFLELDGESCEAGITFLTLNGDIHFRGIASYVQQIDKGTIFTVKRKNGREPVISGEILRICDKAICDPVADTSENATAIKMEVEAICKITYCEWFLP